MSSSPVILQTSLSEKDSEIKRLKRLVTELRGRVRLEGVQHHIELEKREEAHKKEIEKIERMHAEDIERHKRTIQDLEQRYKMTDTALISLDNQMTEMKRAFVSGFVENTTYN